jgi:hypothetical protein
MKMYGGSRRATPLIINLPIRQMTSGRFQAPRKDPVGPTEYEAGWGPEPVWPFLEKRKKFMTLLSCPAWSLITTLALQSSLIHNKKPCRTANPAVRTTCPTAVSPANNQRAHCPYHTTHSSPHLPSFCTNQQHSGTTKTMRWGILQFVKVQQNKTKLQISFLSKVTTPPPPTNKVNSFMHNMIWKNK